MPGLHSGIGRRALRHGAANERAGENDAGSRRGVRAPEPRTGAPEHGPRRGGGERRRGQHDPRGRRAPGARRLGDDAPRGVPCRPRGTRPGASSATRGARDGVSNGSTRVNSPTRATSPTRSTAATSARPTCTRPSPRRPARWSSPAPTPTTSGISGRGSPPPPSTRSAIPTSNVVSASPWCGPSRPGSGSTTSPSCRRRRACRAGSKPASPSIRAC